MAAGRAGRPRGRAELCEDDVWRRLDGRRAGLDDDGGVGVAETTRSRPGGGRRRRRRGCGRDDEIDVVDRKVEDEPVDIYWPGPFSPGSAYQPGLKDL